MNKKVVQGNATRRLLVETARRLFAEHGYEATSVELVLSGAGVSRGAIYHHFDGKPALFEAVLETVEEEIVAEILTAVEGIDDPVGVLRAGCRSWLRIASRPDISRIALLEAPAALGWERWREIDERYGLGLLTAGVAGTVSAAGLDPELIPALSHALLATLVELALFTARDGRSPAQAEAVIDLLLSRLFTA